MRTPLSPFRSVGHMQLGTLPLPLLVVEQETIGFCVASRRVRPVDHAKVEEASARATMEEENMVNERVYWEISRSCWC
jgi:hypothetical protein